METVNCYLCESKDSDILHRDTATRCTIARCQNCGAIYTRDRWTEYEVKLHYAEDSNYQKRCAASWTTEWLASQHSELSVIEALTPNKGSLLDAGCGGGAFVYAAQKRGWQASGIDLSETAIDHARDFFQLNTDSVMQGSFESLVFENSFDVITAFHVLEHIHEPASFLKKVHRALKRKGLFVIAVPNFGSLDVRVSQEMHKQVCHLPYHVIHFTPKTLTDLITGSGFKIIKRKYYPSQWIVKKIKSCLKESGSEEKSMKPKHLPTVNSTENSLNSVKYKLKQSILNIVSLMSPGTYMVFYARPKNK